jgi:phage terminase large subunit-like protein
VLSGEVLACKWIRLACERHQRDIASAKGKGWPYTFDALRAETVCCFVEKFQHVKGRWAARGERLTLSPWQCFFFASLFGWVHKRTRLRRFRKGRLYVARKNGKSAMAATLGLYMFAGDDEAGAEVYSGATTEKQAWEVFGPARQMALESAAFRTKFGIDVNAKTLVMALSMAKFEPVIGKPGDGASPHCSITDEYHEHPTDEQLSTFETGMGAREQPLSLVVSTAGDNLAGPCRDDWLECQRILQNTIEDDRTFALIYAIDEDDDWTSESALIKANPNYGVSVDAEFLQAQQRDAINNPRKQGHFKTKHLNLWVQARDAFINMQRWHECRVDGLRLDDYAGRPCFLGMDLASKIDLTALEIIFPEDDGSFARFGLYYLPEETVELAENQHYRAWHKDGWLNVTPGNQTDYFQLLDDIKDLSERFDITEIAFDPHNATMLVTALQNEGLPLISFGPTVLNFSEPMKQVEALIRDRKLHHNGDPVMTWAMSNVVAKLDRKDNIYPNKERPENKIDPFVALCAAMGRAMLGAPPEPKYQMFVLS